MSRTWTRERIDVDAAAITIEGVRLLESDQEEPSSLAALKLRTGEITVLMGANGAGKTRFMEMIAGLREPEELTIRYGNEALWKRRRLSARGRTKLNGKALLAYAYACQSPEEQLFMRSVQEELRYTLRPYAMPEAERNERMAAAMEAVSWDSAWLERDPYSMSGGERRRTALACLFAPPADWLLLDEPTAGLDAEGHELLGELLKRRAAEGQGILLISHESDWAFELADRILLLQADGVLRSCGKNELLAHPERLTEAGMDVPDWFALAHLSVRLGVAAESVWNPRELAEALDVYPAERPVSRQGANPQIPEQPQAAVRQFAMSASRHHEAAVPNRHGSANAACLPSAVEARDPAAASGRRPFLPRRAGDKPSPIAAFDARAVWLTYIVLSAFLLQLKDWRGIGMAAVLVACAIYFGRIPLRRWKGAIKAIATFTVAVSLFAGFGHHPNGGFWNMAPTLASLQSLLKPLLVMLLGFGLPIAVTPLRLRRSLEQLFSAFGRVPAWGTKLLLTITLLLRFVPVLLSEWERFSRIAAARGKKSAGDWRGALKKIQETALPFMLSLFRLGDQVTDALESRGVGAQSHPTVLVTEIWRLRDTLLVLLGAAAGVLLRL